MSEILTCQVCGLTQGRRRQSGIFVCEACKRFFLRNRNKRNLSTCQSPKTKNYSPQKTCRNLETAVMMSNGSSSSMTPSGPVWRNMCPSCRLSRCKLLGMDNSEDTDIAKIEAKTPHEGEQTLSGMECSDLSPISPPMLHTSVGNFDLKVAEDTLHSIVEGVQLYITSQNNLQPRRFEYDFFSNNAVEAWQITTTQLHNISINIKNYIRFLPGYKNIDIKDRCQLFAKNVLRMMMAEHSNHPEPWPLGMNRVNYAKVAPFFPELAHVESDLKSTKNALDQFQPNLVDFGFLLAFLFCTVDKSETFVNPMAIKMMMDQLEAVYNCYLAHEFAHFRADEAAIFMETRRNQMARSVAVFCSAALRRTENFLTIAEREPQLRSMGKIFIEIVERSKQLQTISHQPNNNNNSNKNVHTMDEI